MKIQLRHLMIVAVVLTVSAVNAQVLERDLGNAAERHLSEDIPRAQWVHDPEAMEERASDALVPMEVNAWDAKIEKLKGVVPPVLFDSGIAQVPPETLRELRSVLEGLANKANVRLHLVGHTDDQPLSASLAARYGDNEGLSRERAGEVAELFQSALGLAPSSISYEWAGATLPVASNETSMGRSQNRRVEVEIWHDKIADGTATSEIVVLSDVRRIKVCRIDTVCKLNYVEGHHKRARVQNLSTLR